METRGPLPPEIYRRRRMLAIGVAAAAIWAAPYAVGFASQFSGVALSGTAANVIGGLATGAIMAVGALAIDALIPLPQPKFANQTQSDVLSVTGARNQERPFLDGFLPLLR